MLRSAEFWRTGTQRLRLLFFFFTEMCSRGEEETDILRRQGDAEVALYNVPIVVNKEPETQGVLEE